MVGVGVSRIDIRAQRRSQILEATRQLVAERGWQGTTFADICRVAGISNGVLTYHFKSKEELRFSLFESELERWRDDFRDAEALVDGADAETRVRLVLERTKRTIEEDPEFYRTLAYYLGNSPVVRPEYAERIRAFFAGVREHIAEHIRGDGSVFSMDEAREMAAVMQTLVSGYAFTRTMIGTDPPIDALIQLATTYIESRKQANAALAFAAE